MLQLNESETEVIDAMLVNGCVSQREIADRLGISVWGVKRRIERAAKRNGIWPGKYILTIRLLGMVAVERGLLPVVLASEERRQGVRDRRRRGR